MNISQVSSQQLRKAAAIQERIEELTAELNGLLRDSAGSGSSLGGVRARQKRNLSPEARERIASAQRARWAKYRSEKVH
jgi:hypothetical protein